MITIQLFQNNQVDFLSQAKEADIDLDKISAMMIKTGGYDGLPSKLYSILVDGEWFAVKDEKEYNRIKKERKNVEIDNS